MAVGRLTGHALAAAILLACFAFNGLVSAQPRRDARLTGEPLVRVDADRGCVNRVRVASPLELKSTLESTFVGCVVIPRNVEWNMTDPCGARDEFGRCLATAMREIQIRSGVSLIGERGELGRRPVLNTEWKYLKSRTFDFYLFRIAGNDVRVEGLHFRGPTPSGDGEKQYRNAIGVSEDAEQKLGRRIVIADNEFEHWAPGSGVEVRGTVDCIEPGPACQGARMRPADAGLVRVERNYFHHAKWGYGVVVYGSAYVTVEGNVFDFVRHAVASNGHAYSGYVARFNYSLEGGFRYSGGNYTSHFDVHGTGKAEEREKGHYAGGWAGEYHEVAFNTIRGAQINGALTRPAFGLRGKAEQLADFRDNVVVHNDIGAAIRLSRGTDRSLDERRPRTFNFRESGNRFNTDYSAELATGDFDGDGRTDVFVANGTAWFFSSAGIRPWAFLHASNKRTHELAFADIDNDGVTDVLYRDSFGNLGSLKSGVQPLVNFTSVPAPIKDLRFGDFDGDRRTDIFYTLGGQWYVWYGSKRAWFPVQSSSRPLSALLFGEFDDVAGTDVVSVDNSSYSSGAIQPWAKLEVKLKNSNDAVAADFDGNGKTDIAFSDGQLWTYNRDARHPAVTLRNGTEWKRYPPLKHLLIGRFDGGTRAQVLTLDGERFVIWNGGNQAFAQRSTQNMR